MVTKGRLFKNANEWILSIFHDKAIDIIIEYAGKIRNQTYRPEKVYISVPLLHRRHHHV